LSIPKNLRILKTNFEKADGLGITYRAVVSGGAGSGILLTLFQPEGADYAHHITASTPGFENLMTSLEYILHINTNEISFKNDIPSCMYC
jgi:hypothetical protein